MPRFLLLMLLAGCGGGQSGGDSRAFCESYELNYSGSCRQNCETDIEPGDLPAIERCEDECKIELSDDDTFGDRCPDRAKQLAGP
jgi:hypothetical protein